MNEALAWAEEVTLTVNGSKLAVGTRPKLTALEPALRGVALSDSPVVVRAASDDQSHLVERLHALGRRSKLPLHVCRSPKDARPLFEGMQAGGQTSPEAHGTWALFGVDHWPAAEQEELGTLLEVLDLGRLHGHLSHERIPRVIVLMDGERSAHVLPSLERRISYFTLMTEAHKSTETP